MTSDYVSLFYSNTPFILTKFYQPSHVKPLRIRQMIYFDDLGVMFFSYHILNLSKMQISVFRRGIANNNHAS